MFEINTGGKIEEPNISKSILHLQNQFCLFKSETKHTLNVQLTFADMYPLPLSKVEPNTHLIENQFCLFQKCNQTYT